MNPTENRTESLLPPVVEQLLHNLVEAAAGCFQDNLKCILLYGSGAEGRLRPTSDLNLLFILSRFERSQVDSFREPLRMSVMAARVAAMFILESELAAAADAFAVKFDDIHRRRRLLYGTDLVAGLTASRAARKIRLRQVLLNLFLRLRERYATISLREEQLIMVITDVAGPLRAAAATLLEMEGYPVSSPKEALEKVAGVMDIPNWGHTLGLISQARESRSLPAGTSGPLMFQLMALAEAMYRRAEGLE